MRQSFRVREVPKRIMELIDKKINKEERYLFMSDSSEEFLNNVDDEMDK